MRRTVTAVADTFLVLDDGTRFTRTAPHIRVNGTPGELVALDGDEQRAASTAAAVHQAGLAVQRAYSALADVSEVAQALAGADALLADLTAWRAALTHDATIRGAHAPASAPGGRRRPLPAVASRTETPRPAGGRRVARTARSRVGATAGALR